MRANIPNDMPESHRLALAYAPVSVRHVFATALILDLRLAAILQMRREPIAAQLRLAWWRERLSEPPALWPRGEPVLDALRQWHNLRGLDAVADGWEALLADELTPDIIAVHSLGRAQGFVAAARELGTADLEGVAPAGQWFALADLAAKVSDTGEREMICEYSRHLPPVPRMPRSLRPWLVLARLGQAALGRGGGPIVDGPGAAFLALRSGLTGW